MFNTILKRIQLRNYLPQVYLQCRHLSTPSFTTSPFVSLPLPTTFTAVPSKILAVLDGDYNTAHPNHTRGSRLFVKDAHAVIKYPERLNCPEDVDVVLTDYLEHFFADNKHVCACATNSPLIFNSGIDC